MRLLCAIEVIYPMNFPNAMTFLITTISSMQVKVTHATKKEKIEKKFYASLVWTNTKSCHNSTQKVSFVGGYPRP